MAAGEEKLPVFVEHKDVDKRWLALCRESYTAAGMLEVGIKTLAHADFNRQDLYYAGFFNVTIAIERICKLVLDPQEFYMTGEFLKSGELSKSGHSLIDLYEKVQEIEKSFSDVSSSREVGIPSNELEDILNFLTDFAKKNRYYNLDSLTKNGGADPIERWKKLVTRYHPMPTLTDEQRTKMRNSDLFGDEEGVLVDMRLLDTKGNNLERPSECMQAGYEDRNVQIEGSLILYSISRYLSKVLGHFSGAWPAQVRDAEKKLDEQPACRTIMEEKMKIRKNSLRLPFYSDFFVFFEHDDAWLKEHLFR